MFLNNQPEFDCLQIHRQTKSDRKSQRQLNKQKTSKLQKVLAIQIKNFVNLLIRCNQTSNLVISTSQPRPHHSTSTLSLSFLTTHSNALDCPTFSNPPPFRFPQPFLQFNQIMNSAGATQAQGREKLGEIPERKSLWKRVKEQTRRIQLSLASMLRTTTLNIPTDVIRRSSPGFILLYAMAKRAVLLWKFLSRGIFSLLPPALLIAFLPAAPEQIYIA